MGRDKFLETGFGRQGRHQEHVIKPALVGLPRLDSLLQVPGQIEDALASRDDREVGGHQHFARAVHDAAASKPESAWHVLLQSSVLIGGHLNARIIGFFLPDAVQPVIVGPVDERQVAIDHIAVWKLELAGFSRRRKRMALVEVLHLVG